MATFTQIKEEASGSLMDMGYQRFPFFILHDNSAFNKHHGTNNTIYKATTLITNEKDRQIIPLGVEDEDLSMAIIKLMRFAHEKIVEGLNAEIEDLKKQINH
jgi:hypothetical protein